MWYVSVAKFLLAGACSILHQLETGHRELRYKWKLNYKNQSGRRLKCVLNVSNNWMTAKVLFFAIFLRRRKQGWMSLFKIQMLVKDDTKAICRWFGVIGEGAEALIDLLKRNFQGQTCKTSILLDMSWRKFECIQLIMAETPVEVVRLYRKCLH